MPTFSVVPSPDLAASEISMVSGMASKSHLKCLRGQSEISSRKGVADLFEDI